MKSVERSLRCSAGSRALATCLAVYSHTFAIIQKQTRRGTEESPPASEIVTDAGETNGRPGAPRDRPIASFIRRIVLGGVRPTDED